MAKVKEKQALKLEGSSDAPRAVAVTVVVLLSELQVVVIIPGPSTQAWIGFSCAWHTALYPVL